ncbi:hypothetical protein CK203_038764 [Vitis vinifera]|uniref:Retrovirus-related Pol polyprotein from transposon TNT 1-94-like beta-barrel domain-containing protein n=1 Tax=Vitis vinifera TaxID=29760 RepID=A0A438I1U2_VITVI|nr:hypothetical protein CK203_038764 [Vitis vinifera]
MLEVAKTTTTTQSEKIVRSQQPGELQNIGWMEKNYLKWSQLVRPMLKGKGKISHLMGVIKTKCPEDAVVLKDFIEQDRKPRHTKEKCWKLNGKPPSREWGNHGGQQRPQAHMAKQPKTKKNSATGEFNSEEMEKLKSLLGSLDKPTGTYSLALSDSGATDHMTSKSQLFHTYTPSPSNKKIAVANGSLATVAGFGDIYITPTLILKNVLHEQGSGRRIGLAKERSGLYHLESS